nr:glycoside hydrolase, family 5 [Tanacetum cinerariifolium]
MLKTCGISNLALYGGSGDGYGSLPIDFVAVVVVFSEFGASTKDPGYNVSFRDSMISTVYNTVLDSVRKGGCGSESLLWHVFPDGTEYVDDGEFGASTKDPGYNVSFRDSMISTVYNTVLDSVRKGGCGSESLLWHVFPDGTEYVDDGLESSAGVAKSKDVLVVANGNYDKSEVKWKKRRGKRKKNDSSKKVFQGYKPKRGYPCYKCRKEGHYVRNCPNGPAKKDKENTVKNLENKKEVKKSIRQKLRLQLMNSVKEVYRR